MPSADQRFGRPSECPTAERATRPDRHPVLAGIGARTTYEGLTFLSGRIGEKLAGEEITVYSDPQHPDIPYAPFDPEGVPRRKATWIDRGVFSGMWWDRWTAHDHRTEQIPRTETVRMPTVTPLPSRTPPGPLSSARLHTELRETKRTSPVFV